MNISTIFNICGLLVLSVTALTGFSNLFLLLLSGFYIGMLLVFYALTAVLSISLLVYIVYLGDAVFEHELRHGLKEGCLKYHIALKDVAPEYIATASLVVAWCYMGQQAIIGWISMVVFALCIMLNTFTAISTKNMCNKIS